eukprot:CAMPEP_0202840682 /NCGR_PEP_ID=MMETSP1389-20130828/56418_1 /ASSEMBLY_ACC=CAM_ASM_000865 /TAXON_ID=302021 /ORGANISM="Rhodomonas sp., Strain CCMP768" /LENGTH=50 /DNA_ID=CAMNT_0049517359 /DNA_START=147 /DNA_END=296 /DNA_ORIENTATION=+
MLESTGLKSELSLAIPMMGRSSSSMSNSTMYDRKNTSPISSPCIPSGEGC